MMSEPTLSRAQRNFFPSIADLLFVGILLTRLGPSLFSDGDTGWHLWAGFFTLGHGAGPIADTLSFTRSGVPWPNVEWLGEVILSWSYGYGGYLAVAFLSGILFAGTVAWLYRILVGETRDPAASLLVTVVVAQILSLQLLARPLLFSFPIFLAVVELVRKPERARLAMILIPLLTLVWANLHPSAYLAPALAVFAWLRRPGRHAYAAAAVLSIGALGATPWGFSWIFSMVAENRAYFGYVEEWASPNFKQLRFLPYLFMILIALSARRGREAVSIWESVWGLGWLSAALFSARLGPYAALAWAPFLARDLAQIGGKGVPVLGRPWRFLRKSLAPMESALRPRVWPVATGLILLLLSPNLTSVYPDLAQGFSGHRFPEAAMSHAAKMNLGPRVLNQYAWGGYISWTGEARWKTFIDGRAGFFGDQLLEDYLAMVGVQPGWEKKLDQYAFDWILLPPGTPLVHAAPHTGKWGVAFEDLTAVLLTPLETQERYAQNLAE